MIDTLIQKESHNVKQKMQKITQNIGLLNARYTIEEEVGIGGISRVYKAKDIYSEFFEDPRELAVKIPSKKLLAKKDIAAFVYSEYSILRQIHHRNIVKVLDFGIDDKTQTPYIVMEYLEGKLLFDMPLYKMSKIFKHKLFKHLLEALVYIHKKGIVHGDITPMNIMVSKNYKVTLFDFGISVNASSNVLGLDYKKNKAFTSKYCAPEVVDEHTPTMSSDLFSFGAVMYEIFTGELPYKQSSSELLTHPLTKKNCSKKIPYTLRSWFLKTVNIEPQKRTHKLPFLHKKLKLN